jgi:heme-degrading monooxygenase HmoA
MRSDPIPAVTLINVFTTAPENQEKLIALLTAATEATVSRAPGFEGAELYRSLDGTKVTMHARWRSAADYEEMRRSSGANDTLAAAMAIATFAPGMYELENTFPPYGDAQEDGD